MTTCRKSFMPECEYLPECEYFTTGGCVSPFNCSYKAEEIITTATSCNLYSPETDKDKEIARLIAENQRLREEAAEQKSIAEHEHAMQMEWFDVACDYKAENAELREKLDKAMGLPYIYEAEVVDSAGHFLKTIYVVVHNNNGTIQAIQYSYKKVAEAKLQKLQGQRTE